MKYGDTLSRRSIPQWRSHNIDYNEIKHFIKERTTPGKGESIGISIPGKGDEKLVDFENALFHILEDQHSRIDLFVTSKAGEIRRRLDHSKKQLKRLSAQCAVDSNGRIPIKRLERYSRLENDVLKAGDEIKSLARFTGIQRTAFRKLLKKYKKWTGSAELENRFRQEVLDLPNGFTHIDLGPLLDDYSETLQSIRSLYENRVQPVASRGSESKDPTHESSSTEQLLLATKDGSRIDFDTAIDTVPFGEQGSLASYWVHTDNIVELQVLLLSQLQHYTLRSRNDSVASSRSGKASIGSALDANSFVLVADDLDSLARKQSAVTIDEREHLAGQRPQRGRVCLRGTTDGDAIVAVCSDQSKLQFAPLKTKHLDGFFDRNARMPDQKEAKGGKNASSLNDLREEALKDQALRPLYKISASRSRCVGTNNGANGAILATLDTDIVMEKALQDDAQSTSTFPFALLQIRQEGSAGQELLSLLQHNHLVERIRGFSLHYHAIWQLYEPKNVPPPFWLSMLSQDIRKLPPPAIRTSRSAAEGSSGTRSTTHGSSSVGDGTTAVSTAEQSSSAIPEQLQIPPLRSFRQKRKRTYAEASSNAMQRQQYWSEYDHPEDGEGNEGSYVLYLDPNEKSTLDRLFERIGKIFNHREPDEEDEEPSPTSPDNDETSSDEEAAFGKMPSYGAISRSSHPSYRRREQGRFLPHVTTTCLSASLALLVVAYILRYTSKHKYATTVDAGVLFAVGCSLAFAVVGFIPVLTRRGGDWFSVAVAVAVLIIDAVLSGGLLAWMLG